MQRLNAYASRQPGRIGRDCFSARNAPCCLEADMRKLLPLLLLISIGTTSAFSQDNQDSNKRLKETVVVTADRIEESVKDTGSAVSVITREQIEQRKVPFVLDLLRTVPGIYISESGNVGKITSVFTRGANSDQTLVMIDGVKINGSTGFIDLSNLSTANVERIEIVRGPQSTLYGSDALGGVINIITRNSGKLVSIRAEGGSDSTYDTGVRSTVGTQRNNISAEFERFKTDGDFKNDDYDHRTFAANGRVQISESTDLGFIYRNARGEVGIPFYFHVPSPDQRQENKDSLIHVPFHRKMNSWWDSELHVSVFDQEIHYRFPSEPFGFTSSDTSSRTTTFHFGNTFHLGNRQSIIAGYEYERIRIDDSSSFGVSLDNAKVDTNAVFGQYQFSPWQPLTITAGLRVDDHSAFGTDTNPRVAVAYQASSDLKLRGTYGGGFRAPRPGELGGPYGNAKLLPEEVKGWDFGADFDLVPGFVSLSATAFHNHFDQMIGFDLNTFRFANFVKVNTSGFEFETLYQPTHSLTFRAAYTYLTTKDQTTGLELLRRPKNSGSLNVDYRWRRWGFNYNWNLIGRRVDLNDITFVRSTDDSYNRADAVISYQLSSDVQVYGRILNLWNEKYQEVFGYQAPNRGVFVGVKLN